MLIYMDRAVTIVEKAIAGGWIETNEKIPEHTMRVAITPEINNGGKDSRFDHAGPMTFKLRDAGAEGKQETKSKPPPKETKDEETNDGKRRHGFTGAAGEHRVQSQLLFHNYETSKPVPDMGVDLIARKGSNSFYLQIKTANKKGNAYYFPLRERAFKNLYDVGSYHVFVMRSPSGAVRCVALSRSFMNMMIKTRKIALVKMGKSNKGYQVRIAENGDAYSIKGEDVNAYVDNWDL